MLERSCLFFSVLTASVLATNIARAQAPTAAQPPAPRIVNIINFIRGVEPRVQMDLLEPVVQQIRLAHEHKLPTTFLIQYDALIQPRFVELLSRELSPADEIGAWLEIVQPQVEAAGLKWHGRFPWDWHTDVGFTVGYTPAERRRLIDVYMDRFRKTFGRLPRSVGCWILDAPTLNYLADKYEIVAACICKDQCGTDGYTLWGGYWNQAYYPSRRNAFMPAQTRPEQVNVPVFRMLGSDPIYQYDHGLGEQAQGVVSLEPVYKEGGGKPGWVRWFFDVNLNAPCLAFAYAQVGQENSFGWPDMSKGLTDQVQFLAEAARAGKVRVETLEASGQWFRRTFPQTPATAVTAMKDWKSEGKRGVWYESRFYRVNLFWEGDAWRIRDLHLFSEDYPERYLHERVTTHACTYDTLPVVDGFNWSTRGFLAGMRPVEIGADGALQPLKTGEPTVEEQGSERLVITMPVGPDGRMQIRCEPKSIRFDLTGKKAPGNWGLDLAWSPDRQVPVAAVGPRAIAFKHDGFAYQLGVTTGEAARARGDSHILLRSNASAIAFDTDCTR